MRTRALLTGVLAVGAAAAMATPAAAADDPTPQVVGGHDATETYSFMVSLQKEGSHTCGASLIKADWAVTAAHCVQGGQPADFTARIGSLQHANGGETAGVSDIKVHDSADLAVFKLDKAVTAKPVNIAADSGPTGTKTRIIGWGQTVPAPGGEAPATLQELDTAIVDDGECSGITGESEVCTSNPGGNAGACYGDSGGPQIKGTPGQWELIGATSRAGNNDSNCATGPSIYTDVSALKGWVDQNTGA